MNRAAKLWQFLSVPAFLFLGSCEDENHPARQVQSEPAIASPSYENAADPLALENRCHLLEGDEGVTLPAGRISAGETLTIRGRLLAPKANLPDAGELRLQCDFIDGETSSRAMMQAAYPPAENWRDFEFHFEPEGDFQGEAVIWNKWEDVPIHLDDLRIEIRKPAP